MPGDPVVAIVKLYVPGVEEPSAQDATTVPFSARIPPEQSTDNPVLGLVVGTRLTDPAKLFLLVRVAWMKTPVTPEFRLVEDWTEMVKSPTWTVTTAEWSAVPGDPVAETVVGYMLDVIELREQSAREVPLGARATEVVGQLIVNPDGVEEAVNVTPPAKLKVLDSVTFREVPAWPTLKLLPTTLIVKSPT